MPPFSPNNYEWQVLDAAIHGVQVEFELGTLGTPVAVIRSEFVKRLILGLELPTKPNDLKNTKRHELSECGIKICGAYFDGAIDLSDGRRGDGAPLVPLLLKDCILAGESEESYLDPAGRPKASLDLSHAYLTRLSLTNCRAGFIDLSDATLIGNLELNGLAAPQEGGQCRVDAKGLQLTGFLYASNTKLNLRQVKIEKPDTSHYDYAFNLSGANISGNVFLRPGFEADGGVNLSNARIGGNCWMDGARLIARDGYALFAQFAEIGGMLTMACLSLRRPARKKGEEFSATPVTRFRTEGGISLYGASMGLLDMRGALVKSNDDADKSGLTCAHMVAKQSVFLSSWKADGESGQLVPFETDSTVTFSIAKISGGLFASNAKLNRTTETRSIVLDGLEISGDINLNNAEVGNVHLNRAVISGKLNMARTRSTLVPNGTEVFADNMSVGSDLRIEDSILNSLSLRGAKIGGSLIADNTQFMAPVGKVSFEGTNLEVSGDIHLRNVVANSIVLWSAKINLDLFLNESRLSTLAASDVQIDGRLAWSGWLTGVGDLQNAQIGTFGLGRDKQNLLRLVKEMGSVPALRFEDMRVKGDFRVWGIEVLRSNRINLGTYPDLRVLSTELECYEDWRLYDVFFVPRAEIKNDTVSVSFAIKNAAETIIFLDGKESIKLVNDLATLQLTTEVQAVEYLKFYAANLSENENGPIVIVESMAQLTLLIDLKYPVTYEIAPASAQKKAGETSWCVTAFVFNQQKLYRSVFEVRLDGAVNLLENDLIASPEGTPTIKYDSPFRFLPSHFFKDQSAEGVKLVLPPTVWTDQGWSENSTDVTEEFRKRIVDTIKFRERTDTASEEKKIQISLKGVKSGSLADEHGNSWNDRIQLDLDGFEYERFDETVISATRNTFDHQLRNPFTEPKLGETGTRKFIILVRNVIKFGLNLIPRPIWKHRLRWLEKQYERMPPRTVHYKPQPYEQVIKVLRAQGNDSDSVRMLLEKFRIERKTKYWRISARRFGSWLLDLSFGYGLLWFRALITFLLFWMAGWMVVGLLNSDKSLRLFPVGSFSLKVIERDKAHRTVLVQESTPVNTIALMDERVNYDTPFATESATLSPTGMPVKEIRCGDQIEPALYAMDTFVPLLDLRQESKCTISSQPDAWLWRIIKSLYAILGWIVTSALILTISGVVRKQVER